jgi:hypothetical protein
MGNKTMLIITETCSEIEILNPDFDVAILARMQNIIAV